MNVAEFLIKILEEDANKFIFGHPGEQILPFYKALKDSSIKHVLTRHEQSAAHAADAYARSSSDYGICMSTAGPGAMNLVMGVSTAFKDSVPILVLTGDNDYSTKDSDIFQSFPTDSVFENITVKSYHPYDAGTAVNDIIEALNILHNYPKGPVHINLSKDVLLEEIEIGDVVLDKIFELFNDGFDISKLDGLDFSFKIDDFSEKLSPNVDEDIESALEKIQLAEKPLIIVGNGIVWSKSIDKLKDFLSKTMFPIVTTYHSKGVVSEYDRLNLGIVGLRGNSLSDYAYKNADMILVLGAKLSERTIAASDFDIAQRKMIHVNIDEDCLKGDVNLCMDVSEFLDCLIDALNGGAEFNIAEDWLDEIHSHYEPVVVEGIDDVEDNFNPLRPPYVINKIIESFRGAYFLSDAGTHTTWTTLLSRSDKFGKLLFSGGFGPMGYGLAGSIGVAFALRAMNEETSDKVVVICGDGDIQMVIQELATLKQYDLNISVFVINNSQLGIIRQWEETIYGFDSFEVDLINPNFEELAGAYGIESATVKSKEDLISAIERALAIKGPFLADVHVVKENIPIPNK